MVLNAYIVLLFVTFLFPLEFVVEPYLQNSTPNSIYILWETDSNSDSQVEWGSSIFLGEIFGEDFFYEDCFL